MVTGTITKIFRFYAEGFRALRLGRTLWKLIALKLLIMFGIFKLLFFNDTLHTRYDTDAARSTHVLENLTKESK